MNNLSKNKQLIINLVATIISMIINYGISFFFTPYLIRETGGEAYGFVSLANNMVNYATIVTIALNSVAGRFITIRMHQNNKEVANQYFNSVIGANIFFSGIIIIVFIPVIYNLQNILEIPREIVNDVKALFLFIVFNFIISIISNVFSVATFITNKLYLSSLGNGISSLIRVCLLVTLFSIFPANVMYIGIVSCICTLFVAVYNKVLTAKLKTGLVIDRKYMKLGKVKELLSSGIWNSVTKLSQILSDGLDLLISNVWVGAYTMGQLSISYTIPTIISSLLSSVASLFNPQQTYYYAKGDIKGVVAELKLNMKMSGFCVSIIFSVFIVFGHEFFELWAPTQNVDMIYHLSLLAIVSVLVSGVTSSLNSIFLLTDRLKVNSLVWLLVSVVDVVIVLILVVCTGLGVYAVAGVSKIVGLIVNLTYTPIYSCVCLEISKKTFYPLIGRYMICTFVLLVMCKIFFLIMPDISDWTGLILEIAFCGGIGVIFNFIFFLNTRERDYLLNTVLCKFKR